MHSNLEQPEPGFVNVTEEFKRALTKKVKIEIKQLLQTKVEEYYRHRVNHQELNGTVERLFNMLLQGASEQEIESALDSSAEDVLKKSE